MRLVGWTKPTKLDRAYKSITKGLGSLLRKVKPRLNNLEIGSVILTYYPIFNIYP